MPTKRLANTFKAQTPLGQGLQALSQALFAGDGRNAELDAANIAHHKASIGKLGAETSAANLKREGFQKLSDTFRMIPRAQDAVREGAPQWAPGQGGVDMLNPDAPVSSAFQQQGNFDTSSKFLREAPAQAMSSALQAGHDPKNVSEAFRGLYALDPKTSDADLARAVVGAGSLIGKDQAVSIPDRESVAKRENDASKDRVVTTTGMNNRTSIITTGMTNKQSDTNNRRTVSEQARGNDLSSADRRYNTDRDYDASTENNKRTTAVQARAKSVVEGDALAANPELLSQVLTQGKAPQVPRNYISKDGAQQGVTYDGVTDASSGELLPSGTQIRDNVSTRADAERKPTNYFDPVNGKRGRTLDGRTDMTDGTPLSASAQSISNTIQDTSEGFSKNEQSAVRKKIDDSEIATRKFEAAADEVLGMLSSPDAAKRIGMMGGINRVANGFRAQAVAVMNQAGIQVEASTDPQTYEAFFAQNGIPAGDIRSAMLDLAFATASAREGGKLTDKDVLNALQTNGGDLQDPKAIISTINRSKAARRRDADIARSYYEEKFPDLRKGKGSGGGPVSGALGGGAPKVVNSQAEYDALPVGTSYTDSAGNTAVKR